MSPSSLLLLPQECLHLILARLTVSDVVILSTLNKELNGLIKDPQLWRQLAEAKWGTEATALRQGTPTDWIAYCKQRICPRPIRRSSIGLIQEQFNDPWQHLICCLLCSRTSGSESIHNAIHRFLRLYPSPSAVLRAPAAEVKRDIETPLGLADARCKAVQGMSRSFLAEDWVDVQEFYGCGKFTADSYRIFCRGDLSGQGVEDVNLRRYLRWASTGDAGEKKPRARKAVTKLPAAGTLRSGVKRKQALLPSRRSARARKTPA